ncbi:HAD-superfamily hydrolase [Marinomonas sp. MED121]|uniref:HAD-IA family hydrolase n=1 Tax=Marinomonas sp. MED121 TaxID=314277 RepID=UPI00006904E9|nr:HAD-IA family hydrolase [Marinomonas sp. MED121]EAQ64762.1 HAD-superfamily hydrolase [Marinomonas sp. MED121]
MTRLITFDLDNTLWDVEPVIVRADQAMFHWFEDRFPGFNQAFDNAALFKLKTQLLEDSSKLRADISQLRIEVYRIALQEFGLPKEEAGSVAKAAFDFFHQWRQKVDLYPGTKKVLWQLANHYRLAVITNGNADVYHPEVGLADSFEFAVRADIEGIAKPHADIFVKAADIAKVDVTSLIHVGDNVHDDVNGINQVGGRSIWFNRHGARRWQDSWQGRPDAEVHALEELPEVIADMIAQN